MKNSDIEKRGIILLGCGKMGSAMLAGWLADGLPETSVHILDPNPSDWVQGLAAKGAHLNKALPNSAAVCVLAVKPQMMGDALPDVAGLDGDTIYLSIAAGTTLRALANSLGAESRIVRAMPNTPAAIGQGITALIGNEQARASDIDMCENLLSAIGQTVRLSSEDQMDAVTGLSGSGPAYVFHMIDTMAAAGVAQGLPADMAMKLAKATVAGAGAYAVAADETPTELRINVTSPNGTTQAGLEVLMGRDALDGLIDKTVAAAADRSRELGK